MLKVQYTLSRSKCQAVELGSSLGERPEIAEPVLQWTNLCRMGIQCPACNLIKHCSWNTNLCTFGLLIPCHHIHHDTVLTSIHHMQRSLMDMIIKYIYMLSYMPLYMANCISSGTMCNISRMLSSGHVDTHRSIRLCSYWKTKRCL